MLGLGQFPVRPIFVLVVVALLPVTAVNATKWLVHCEGTYTITVYYRDGEVIAVQETLEVNCWSEPIFEPPFPWVPPCCGGEPPTPPDLLGACCRGIGQCTSVTQQLCEQLGASFKGIGILCGSCRPEFTTQPTDQSFEAGGSATFRCEASGTGTINYTWLRDGSTIGSGTVLTLDGLTEADHGTTVWCRVVDDCGTSTAAAQALIECSEPCTAVCDLVGPSVVTIGDASVFTASDATGPACAGVPEWHNVGGTGTPAAGTGATFEVCWTSSGTAAVDFTGVRHANPGCGDGTPLQVIAAACPLVQVSPCEVSFASFPTQVCVGELAFYATTSGATELEWWLDGQFVAAGSSGVWQTVYSSPGTHSVSASGARYGCVSTDCGEALDFTTVLPNLEIVSPPEGRAGMVGGSVTFSVQATGAGLTYEWRRGGSVVGTGDVLTLSDLTPAEDGAQIQVTVHSPCGNWSSPPVTLSVIELDIALDGNRDRTIDRTDPADESYLFWVNDDHDYAHPSLTDLGAIVEDDGEGLPNAEDDVVNELRDLEDFARLHLFLDPGSADESTFEYYLRFENVVSGAPEINLFKAPCDDSYLFEESNASVQTQRTRILTVTTIDSDLPSNFIVPNDLDVNCFVFEGKRTGEGDLAFIVRQNGHFVGSVSARIDLRPIDHFYRKWMVENYGPGPGDVDLVAEEVVETYTYSPSRNDMLLYVHGWNMSEPTKDRWVETLFKRLWWSGYDGHVALFSWPTVEFPTWEQFIPAENYSFSEFRAFRSAIALRGVLNQVSAEFGGSVHILAHSQGNIVTSEALNHNSPTLVRNYIATQAASPYDAYDHNTPPTFTGYETPDVWAHFYSGSTPDQPYFSLIQGNAVATHNFFNTEDFALQQFEVQNGFKPLETFAPSGFRCAYFDGDGDLDTYEPSLGDRFVNLSAQEDLVMPAERFEIFAFCAESRSSALGATADLPPSFSTNFDLLFVGSPYDNMHYSHSRQFRSAYTEMSFYFQRLLDAAMIPY